MKEGYISKKEHVCIDIDLLLLKLGLKGCNYLEQKRIHWGDHRKSRRREEVGVEDRSRVLITRSAEPPPT